MRTRSQPISPGGFVSLDNDSAPRRTRSTRSASQASAQPPAPQPATRSKSQRTTKKTATASTSTRKPTKTESQKAPKRATRSSTRKADKQTSGDEAQDSADAAEQEAPEPPTTEHKNSPQDEPQSPEHEKSTSDTALSEKTETQSESENLSLSKTQEPPFPIPNPKESHKVSPKTHSPGPQDTHNPPDTPQCQLALEGISDVGSPLSSRSRTPSLEPDEAGFALDLEIDEALVAEIEAALAIHDCQEASASQDVDAPAVVEDATSLEAEQPVSEQAESGSPEAKPVVEQLEQSSVSSPAPVIVVSPEEIDELVERLGKLRLAKQAAVPVGGKAKPGPWAWGGPKLVSIYDDAPPAPLNLPSLAAACCLAVKAPPKTLFNKLMGCDHSSIWPDGVEPPHIGPVKEPPVEESRGRSTSVRHVHFPLSPIPEEPEEPTPPSKPARKLDLAPFLGEPEANPSDEPPSGEMKPWSVPPLVSRDTEATSPAEKRSSWVPIEGIDVDAPYKKLEQKKKKKNKKETLTSQKVNRKRAPPSPSEEDHPGLATPSNKRRNLGPPGSTPFARRRTPLPRRLTTTAIPYTERLRRRKAEAEGRIVKTCFRLPQLIAQNEADRQAAERGPLDPCPEFPHTNFEFRVERTEAENESSTDEPESQQASAPETPQQRGWNIRGLLSSVPRSFSRFIPTFGRSSSSSDASGVPQPSSERVTRTAPSHSDSTRSNGASQRRLSDQQSGKQIVDLSYSLFPPRYDRTRYLPDPPIPEGPYRHPYPDEAPLATQETPSKSQATKPTELSVTAERESDPQTQTPTDAQKKKRKRSSSPDVIPNPVGSSYGMDLDYFCYSSDSDEDTEVAPQQPESFKKSTTLTKSAVRSAPRSERPSKKVRFDSSPENTPSKRRVLARATDPYNGRHFIGMGNAARSSEETTPASPTSASATPTPARVDQSPQRPPGFIPNKQGTFTFDYDALSDDSESSGPPPASASSPSSVSEPRTPSARTDTQESAPSPAPRPTPRQTPLPSTPAKVDEEALAKVRSQAEKYKPKTPSGLRTTSRYSSPMVATPETAPDTLSVAASEKEPVEKFGDDQFARDAEWLYENCPSGDLSKLVWPAKQSLKENLGVSSDAINLLDEIWDHSEVDGAYRVFQQSLREFGETLA